MTAAAALGDAVVGEDGLARCPWAAGHPLNRHYHDTEWGLPVRGERPAFRTAFADFAPDVVAAFGDDDVERLMGDAGIVRNRAKILAARTNARANRAARAGPVCGRLEDRLRLLACDH